MQIHYNARGLLLFPATFKLMRPVEVKIISKDGGSTLEFRSIRTAYQFIEDSIESDKTLHMIHSRVHVSNRLTEGWLLVAADASRAKHYLIRLKPTH